jgi:hypothetical protein
MIEAREYELFVRTFYARLMSETGSSPVILQHRKKYTGESGQAYEIDLSYEKLIGGEIRILILFECKAYARRVKLNDLLEFAEKLKDLRASKGVFITTVGYERGAYVVARANHIGLAILRDESWLGRALATHADPIPPMPFFMTMLQDVTAGETWAAAMLGKLYRELSAKGRTSDLLRIGRLASYMEDNPKTSWADAALDLFGLLWIKRMSRAVTTRLGFEPREIKSVRSSRFPVLLDDQVIFSIPDLLVMEQATLLE